MLPISLLPPAELIERLVSQSYLSPVSSGGHSELGVRLGLGLRLGFRLGLESELGVRVRIRLSARVGR